MPCLFAASLCPISWEPRIAIIAAEKAAAPRKGFSIRPCLARGRESM